TLGGTMPDPALERLRLDRQSVLDTVKGDLAAIRCQLGVTDRATLDQHLEAVRALERSLSFTSSTPVGASCKPPAKSAGGFVNDGRAQLDNAVAAFACDATRVATMVWSSGASGVVHSWVGAGGSHHGISHGSDGVTAGLDQRRDW